MWFVIKLHGIELNTDLTEHENNIKTKAVLLVWQTRRVSRLKEFKAWKNQC